MTAAGAVPSLAAVEQALLARWPENRIAPSLERMTALMTALGSPQRAVPVIHVAGTNGKTTTARIIDDLLRAAGLRVGRYTSPHLRTMRERIVVDGAPLDAARFVAAHQRVAPAVAEVDARSPVPLSFFEIVTAMAYVTFADTPVDVAVVEVGLGGRWDATNVAAGEVAVITPIGLDHTELLGPDEVSIAGEKAGIIKPGAVVVLAGQTAPVETVLTGRARDLAATVVRVGRDAQVVSRTPQPEGQLLELRGVSPAYRDLVVTLPLLGRHQAENALTALTAVETFLAPRGALPSAEVIQRTFAQVSSPGRLETVGRNPRVLVDASHNPAGMAVTAAALREAFPGSRVIAVVAALAGKDVAGMLRELTDVVAEVLVTGNGSARSLPPGELADLAVDALGADRVSVFPDLAAALDAARYRAAEQPGRTAVLVTGSVVTAGEALALLT